MSAYAKWSKDLASTQKALEGHVIEVDGTSLVDTRTAPADLVRLHRGLLSVGYANGWTQDESSCRFCGGQGRRGCDALQWRAAHRYAPEGEL